MTNIGYINPYSYSAVASASGKLHVPVSPAAVVYAQFDNISGVAAREGEAGISINRIHILNSLIEHVRALQTVPQAEKITSNAKLNAAASMTAEETSFLIDTYQQQILDAADAAPYTPTGAHVESGELFAVHA
ncbi:MAG: hypothetical protein J6I73_00365 [Treponema sp.]|nr:hypothetical protein [Treponema sp.]